MVFYSVIELFKNKALHAYSVIYRFVLIKAHVHVFHEFLDIMTIGGEVESVKYRIAAQEK